MTRQTIPVFHERIYALLRTVPRGKVTTYMDLAHALGTRAYRAVGQAMRHNPFAPQVPCHRVVASDGRIGGFGGVTRGEPVARKIALLKREGVAVQNGRVVEFGKRRHRFARR
jgi:methylated-DNA-[protein]-cysteine S-methyltransferase